MTDLPTAAITEEVVDRVARRFFSREVLDSIADQRKRQRITSDDVDAESVFEDKTIARD